MEDCLLLGGGFDYPIYQSLFHKINYYKGYKIRYYSIFIMKKNITQ